MGAVSQERVIALDAGTPESVWRPWLAGNPPPHWSWRDCIGPAVRLVVLAPHPDDELLCCGGLLAMHAQAGGDCLIVGVTDGEASHAPAPLRPRGLAATRAHERRAGLLRLGLRGENVLRLGLPDGGVQRHGARLMSMLSAVLRPDDVVVCTWRLDGHPDHDAVGLRTAQVCLQMGCRLVEAPVWMWHWATPGDTRVPWSRLHGVALEGLALPYKQHALAAHASQLAPRGPAIGPVLDEAIVERSCRGVEYFFL